MIQIISILSDMLYSMYKSNCSCQTMHILQLIIVVINNVWSYDMIYCIDNFNTF